MDADSKGLIATYGKVVDFTNRNAIVPIINAIIDGNIPWAGFGNNW